MAVAPKGFGYYGMAIKELRAQGREVPDELLSFIAPGHRENINFFGFIEVDIEAETRQTGRRLATAAANPGERVRHHLPDQPLMPKPWKNHDRGRLSACGAL
ncbi:hypothetical protein [Nonomuraea dietziae]|uniref:hypothetical protein n=1 Tax=Nonomuraea dietziae TaxID=65515 RepID=UPI0034078DA7